MFVVIVIESNGHEWLLAVGQYEVRAVHCDAFKCVFVGNGVHVIVFFVVRR